MSDQEVTVRMYTQGLGDCFLLRFPYARPQNGRDAYHIVIDCGVFRTTNGGKERMIEVARSIRDSTGGHVDLLLATHEHWDHLSGFVQAFEVWDEEITIDKIWMSWVENDEVPEGFALRAAIDARAQALRQALAVLPSSQGARAATIGGILEFLADGEEDGDTLGVDGAMLGADGTKPRTKAQAIAYLKRRADRDAEVTFHEPGERPFTPEGLPGVRIYVLGPPRDESLLGKEDPSKTNPEVYEFGPGLTLADTFSAALDGDGDHALRELCCPFDTHHKISPSEVERADHVLTSFFTEQYSDGGEWRKIDEDWYSIADQLALNLDNVVNNTSLAVAIELVKSGRVLLFAADAQVGNWLSWEKVEFKWQENGQERLVKGPQLLARTVFYKVGHHGSHNATLREKGLEMMAAGGDLVAMIPVDKVVVDAQGWEMPFGTLRDRLFEKTKGRLIVAIDGKPALNTVAPEVRAAFDAATTAGANFIEYKLRG
jgi:hypothetical protein